MLFNYIQPLHAKLCLSYLPILSLVQIPKPQHLGWPIYYLHSWRQLGSYKCLQRSEKWIENGIIHSVDYKNFSGFKRLSHLNYSNLLNGMHKMTRDSKFDTLKKRKKKEKTPIYTVAAPNSFGSCFINLDKGLMKKLFLSRHQSLSYTTFNVIILHYLQQ